MWLRVGTVALAFTVVVAPRLSAVPPTGGRQLETAAPSSLPLPEEVIGWAPCADYKLATYEQIADYFRKLDTASPRMQLVEIGQTVEGRPQLLAIISSEANLRNLARYKDIARRLALTRGLTDAEARALAREGKAIVWIDFGLHSTEVAHAQTAPLMAYRAVAGENEEMRFIRDNVIFLLMPNMNPDGTTLVADWYMGNLGTPYAHVEPPELYHRYVGHDNNRDWYMFTQPETQNVGRQLYVEWFPQIVYNQHQPAPFPARIFIPPFADPMNPNIPPLVMRGVGEIGAAMARRFAREDKPGVISRLQFDTWWNGGMRSTPYYHNMIGILTETGHTSPDPAVYDPETFPQTFTNGEPTLLPSSFYPNPFKGGEWHLRDSCDYMVTASMAVLDIGARRRSEWLYDIYRMGRDAIRVGTDEAYVMPAAQWDAGATAKLVNVLRWGAIEVERANTAVTIAGRTHQAGSYVVRGAQPFRSHLTDLLNPQVYPDRRLHPDGPPQSPYDIAGWTLPFQMGVTIERLTGPGIGVSSLGRPQQESGFERVEWASPPTGEVAGRAGFAYVIDPRSNNAATAVNRLLRAGQTVYRAAAAVRFSRRDWPAGTFLVESGSATHDRIETETAELGLSVATLDAPMPGELWHLTMPRIGMYHGWGGNVDEGWTRWLLEQYEFPYTRVHDREIRAGDLRARYDVIVLPDASYDRMLRGLSLDRMPPQYTGGMTPAGVANLHAFVEAGGTLVAMDSAAELPLKTFDLPVRDVTENLEEADLYIPGSILQLNVDPSHPVAYGMPARAAAFLARSPAFSVGLPAGRNEQSTSITPGSPGSVTVAAEYPSSDLLMSGWLLGEHLIAGQWAVVHARVGEGQVVLLGFRTQHRGQAHGTFKLLFNSLYLGGMRRMTIP